jgi:tetratricopeptide (TPR) repeat protein
MKADNGEPTGVTGVTVAGLRRRRILMLWISLPFVLLTIVVAMKLLSLAPTAQLAMDAYDSGRWTSSQDISTSLLSPNIVEQYLPYFNRGDASAADQYYGPATDDFEKALELAPMERKCDVRLNLALTWERFGDIYVANGYDQGAVLLYKASRAVLDAAGPECDPPEKMGQLNESKDRVRHKMAQAESDRDAQRPDSGDGPSGQDQQLQDLQDQQAQADQEKADKESEERGQGEGGYSVDKPW